ncbi:MAG TPA: DinB family protein [Actinomycetota bacterium]|nr:DinB family protein [Actinomycetota bacterium]
MELMHWIAGQQKGVRGYYEMNIRSLVPPEQQKIRPTPASNSIVWLMWHVARTEDTLVNRFLRADPQLIESKEWAERIGVADQRIGTGYSDDEVEGFSAAADPAEVDAYWEAVSKSTRAWLKTISAEDLDLVPDAEGRLGSGPALSAKADDALVSVYKGRSVGFALANGVIMHGYLHVGEMAATRGLLGVSGWL